MHVRLVERVEAAGRDVRQHQCAGARILDGRARRQQRAPQREMPFEIVAMDVALRNQRIVQRRAIGHVNRRVVATCAGAFLGEEQLVLRRIVDRADQAHAALDIGDRNAPVAHAVHEVERAVDRVDHPQSIRQRAARFLAEHRIAGKALGDRIAHVCLHGMIRDAHPVLPLAFRLGGERELAEKVALRQRAGRAGERAGERRAIVQRRAHARAGGITTTP